MSTITFVFIAGLVKALVDVLKRVIPPLNNDETVFGVDHFWAKLIAVVGGSLRKVSTLSSSWHIGKGPYYLRSRA